MKFPCDQNRKLLESLAWLPRMELQGCDKAVMASRAGKGEGPCFAVSGRQIRFWSSITECNDGRRRAVIVDRTIALIIT